MSFRKRNVGLSSTQSARPAQQPASAAVQRPGLKPSPVDGRLVTSTGTASLDNLFAGHAGLPLGSLLLLEEGGTTDYTGILTKFYVAEGIAHGHHVHVVALPELWGRELPAIVDGSEKPGTKAVGESQKMKIAWRYERMGQHGADSVSRERTPSISSFVSDGIAAVTNKPFCHTFDLTKRLVHPPSSQLSFLPLNPDPSRSPFDVVIARMTADLHASPTDTVHRIVVPGLLSPALYPSHAARPEMVLRFQHALRALLAVHADRLTVLECLPLSLYPRSTGLSRWLELLSDGVVELQPFPHSADAEVTASRDPTTKDDPPQGMLKVHRVPIFHDRASGQLMPESDWTFTLSRRKFTIKPFNLPPVEGDTEAQQNSEKPSKAELDF